MVVITLESCPAALRGDLTKWLQEVSLGVYVGQISARVRDKLWERVCDEAKTGRATMVFSTRNEQRYDFRVHNAAWEPIDFDGIKLMMRPSPARMKACGKKRVGLSDASKRRIIRKARSAQRTGEPREYVVFDIETTGLDSERDEIIEIAGLKVVNGEEKATFQCLVRPHRHIPKSISELTGLTGSDMKNARETQEAIEDFLLFAGDYPLVAHNAGFDISFLESAMRRFELGCVENEVVDTLELARKKLSGPGGYSLERVASHFGLVAGRRHRALDDVRLVREVLLKLIE